MIYIPNDDTQNYPFCRLKYWFKSLDQPIKFQLKYSKFKSLLLRYKKGYKTLGTSVILGTCMEAAMLETFSPSSSNPLPSTSPLGL